MGFEESQEGTEEKDTIATLLQNRLGIPKPNIAITYRMGAEQGKAPRPLLIVFSNRPHKLAVWYKKANLNNDQPQKLWLQEDLPKPLRTELNALLKVQKKAKSLPKKYSDVKIKDFRIIIKGWFCPLHSNTWVRGCGGLFWMGVASVQSSSLQLHHLGENIYLRWALPCLAATNVADNKPLAQSVLEMKYPAEHKKVLTSLKEINADGWAGTVENIP